MREIINLDKTWSVKVTYYEHIGHKHFSHVCFIKKDKVGDGCKLSKSFDTKNRHGLP